MKSTDFVEAELLLKQYRQVRHLVGLLSRLEDDDLLALKVQSGMTQVFGKSIYDYDLPKQSISGKALDAAHDIATRIERYWKEELTAIRARLEAIGVELPEEF